MINISLIPDVGLNVHRFCRIEHSYCLIQLLLSCSGNVSALLGSFQSAFSDSFLIILMCGKFDLFIVSFLVSICFIHLFFHVINFFSFFRSTFIYCSLLILLSILVLLLHLLFFSHRVWLPTFLDALLWQGFHLVLTLRSFYCIC